eukprot:jgi/Botrbrau1/4939/Bobra.0122s0021.1
MDGRIWRPRRRLRHLQSVQVRNLWGAFAVEDISSFSSYLVIWSRLPSQLPPACPCLSPSQGETVCKGVAEDLEPAQQAMSQSGDPLEAAGKTNGEETDCIKGTSSGSHNGEGGARVVAKSGGGGSRGHGVGAGVDNRRDSRRAAAEGDDVDRGIDYGEPEEDLQGGEMGAKGVGIGRGHRDGGTRAGEIAETGSGPKRDGDGDGEGAHDAGPREDCAYVRSGGGCGGSDVATAADVRRDHGEGVPGDRWDGISGDHGEGAPGDHGEGVPGDHGEGVPEDQDPCSGSDGLGGGKEDVRKRGNAGAGAAAKAACKGHALGICSEQTATHVERLNSSTRMEHEHGVARSSDGAAAEATWHPVYISKAESATIAPDFGPVNIPDAGPEPTPYLHSLLSGLIHVHLYVLPTADALSRLADVSVPPHPAARSLPNPAGGTPAAGSPRPSKGGISVGETNPTAPLAVAVPATGAGVGDQPACAGPRETGAGGDPLVTRGGPGREHAEGGAVLPQASAGMLDPEGAAEQGDGSGSGPLGSLRDQGTAFSGAGPGPGLVAAACQHLEGLPGELVLAVSLDLDTLQDLPGGTIPPWLPHNTLLLEMDGAWHVYPALPPTLLQGEERHGEDTAGAEGPESPGALEGGSRALWRTPQRGDSVHGTPAGSSPEGAPAVPPGAPRVGLFARVLGGRSVPYLAGLSSTPERRPGGAPADRSGRATPIDGDEVAVDPEELIHHLTAAWETAAPSRGTVEPPQEPAVEEASSVQSGLVGLLQGERSLRQARSRRDATLSRLNQMLEERGRGREQRAQLEGLRQRVANLGQRERKAVQGAARARKAAQLSFMVLQMQARALDAALAAMKAATERMMEAEEGVRREALRGTLRNVLRRLIGRRCVLASSLATIFQIGPHTITEAQAPPGGFPWEKLDHLWTGEASEDGNGVRLTEAHLEGTHGDLAGPQAPSEAGVSDVESSGASSVGAPSSLSRLREVAVLCIGGLELEPMLWRKGAEGVLGGEADPGEARRAAAALGYIAHCLVALEQYLDVPLRYPIRAAGSHSVVMDFPPPAGTYGEGEGTASRKVGDSGFLYLLQLRGAEEARPGTALPPSFRSTLKVATPRALPTRSTFSTRTWNSCWMCTASFWPAQASCCKTCTNYWPLPNRASLTCLCLHVVCRWPRVGTVPTCFG